MAKPPASTSPSALSAQAEPLVATGTVLPNPPDAAETAALVGDAAKPAPDPTVTVAALSRALSDAANSRSVPAKGPVPPPMPAVQPFGTKGATLSEKPTRPGEDAFDRRSVIETLLTHPSPEVRQRAAEAQVAIHHGAADVGIKVKAAIDTARGAESRR